MSVEQFRDDDDGYLAWTAAHPHTGTSPTSSEASTPVMPACTARTVTRSTISPPGGGTWTELYIKICSESARDLQDWAEAHVSRAIPRCKAPGSGCAVTC